MFTEHLKRKHSKCGQNAAEDEENQKVIKISEVFYARLMDLCTCKVFPTARDSPALECACLNPEHRAHHLNVLYMTRRLSRSSTPHNARKHAHCTAFPVSFLFSGSSWKCTALLTSLLFTYHGSWIWPSGVRPKQAEWLPGLPSPVSFSLVRDSRIVSSPFGRGVLVGVVV